MGLVLAYEATQENILGHNKKNNIIWCLPTLKNALIAAPQWIYDVSYKNLLGINIIQDEKWPTEYYCKILTYFIIEEY